MGRIGSRNSLYWLLLADMLVRSWIARDLPEPFRIAGLVLHFLIGLRIGGFLFARFRFAGAMALAPVAMYGFALIVSSLDIDRFSLLFQWLLALVLIHAPIATNEAARSATNSENHPGSRSSSEERQPASPQLFFGLVLLFITAGLALYMLTFDTRGALGMALFFGRFAWTTPVLVLLCLVPRPNTPRRERPRAVRLLHGIALVLLVLSWIFLLLRACGAG
jgi:hypothetical protein